MSRTTLGWDEKSFVSHFSSLHNCNPFLFVSGGIIFLSNSLLFFFTEVLISIFSPNSIIVSRTPLVAPFAV